MKRYLLLLVMLAPALALSQTKGDATKVDELIERAAGEPQVQSRVKLLSEAGEIAASLAYFEGQYNVYMAIGRVYQDLNSFIQALGYYQKAHDIAQKMGDEEKRGNGLNAIGGIYYALEDWQQSGNYFKEALKIRKATGNKRLVAGSLINVGEIYRFQGKMKEAMDYYNQAIEINKEINNRPWLCINYNNMALAAIKMNQPEKAMQYLRKSNRLAIELESKDLRVMVMTSKAEVYNSIMKYDEAIRQMEIALQLDKDNPVSLVKRDIYRELSKAYEFQGNIAKAMNYYKLFEQCKDSLFNEQKLTQLVLTEVRFDATRRDQQLAELRHKNQINQLNLKAKRRERNYFFGGGLLLVVLMLVIYGRFRAKKRNNQLLRESLNEKDMLLKEIHHRVKNNFQMISSLLNLQSNTIKDETAREALKDGRHRINSMALVHQNLYLSKDVSKVDMQQYLEELVTAVTETFEVDHPEIKSSIRTNKISFDVDTAIPVGLITNELVTNTVKYAFDQEENNRIEIILQEVRNGVFELSISDNGKGLPKGFDMEKVTTFGLELVQLLTDQLNGKLECDSQNGTSFSIRFSLVQEA